MKMASFHRYAVRWLRQRSFTRPIWEQTRRFSPSALLERNKKEPRLVLQEEEAEMIKRMAKEKATDQQIQAELPHYTTRNILDARRQLGLPRDPTTTGTVFIDWEKQAVEYCFKQGKSDKEIREYLAEKKRRFIVLKLQKEPPEKVEVRGVKTIERLRRQLGLLRQGEVENAPGAAGRIQSSRESEPSQESQPVQESPSVRKTQSVEENESAQKSQPSTSARGSLLSRLFGSASRQTGSSAQSRLFSTSCRRRYEQGRPTAEEVEIVRGLAREGKNNDEILGRMPTRSSKWIKRLRSDLGLPPDRGRPYTAQEVDIVIDMAQKGHSNVEIHDKLPHRSNASIQRARHALACPQDPAEPMRVGEHPEIPFTPEEDRKLLMLRNEQRLSWERIRRIMPQKADFVVLRHNTLVNYLGHPGQDFVGKPPEQQ